MVEVVKSRQTDFLVRQWSTNLPTRLRRHQENGAPTVAAKLQSNSFNKLLCYRLTVHGHVSKEILCKQQFLLLKLQKC